MNRLLVRERSGAHRSRSLTLLPNSCFALTISGAGWNISVRPGSRHYIPVDEHSEHGAAVTLSLTAVGPSLLANAWCMI